MQTFLAHVQALSPSDRDAVLADIGPASVAAITASRSFLAWLPVERNLDATRAVARQLGPKRTHAFFVRLQAKTLESPLFDWVRRNADLLLGPDPARALKWIARAYSLMFANAGTWVVTGVDQNGASLEMRGVPSMMLQERVWLDSVSSALHALFRDPRTEGSVNLVDVVPEAGRATFRMRWFVDPEM